MSSPACLFDLPAPGEYQCPRCLEVSPTRYMHELNHHPVPNSELCTHQYLTMMHEKSRANRPEIQKENAA